MDISCFTKGKLCADGTLCSPNIAGKSQVGSLPLANNVQHSSSNHYANVVRVCVSPASLNTAMSITKYRNIGCAQTVQGPSGRLNRAFSSITDLDGGRAGSQVVRVRRLPRDSLSLGENVLYISFFLHRREVFHRRSIGYSELEVVASSSLQQSEFLCAEACHTPVEDAIFGGRLRGSTHSGLVLRNQIGQFQSAND